MHVAEGRESHRQQWRLSAARENDVHFAALNHAQRVQETDDRRGAGS
jgi:hypothetical protein